MEKEDAARKARDEAYAAGHAAGYALGYSAGTSTGYVDAKLRAWNAVNSLDLPNPAQSLVRDALSASIGRPT